MPSVVRVSANPEVNIPTPATCFRMQSFRTMGATLRGAVAQVVQAFASGYGAKLLGFDPLDQAPLHRAMADVFGQDTLPDFDIANTGYLLSFGSDFLGTWVAPTHFAGGFGEFRQGNGRQRRGHLVQIESRFSLTAAAADE